MKKRNKAVSALVLAPLIILLSCCMCSQLGGAINSPVPSATATPKNNPKDTPSPTPTAVNIGRLLSVARMAAAALRITKESE